MPTRTWVVIRSQRFLKLEGKSFHTSLFFVSLFVLTFARRLCVLYCVGVGVCAVDYITHLLLLLGCSSMAAMGMMRWCVLSTCYSVTVLHGTCRTRWRIPCTRIASTKQCTKEMKSEHGRSRKMRRWTSSGIGSCLCVRETVGIGNCRGAMHRSIRDSHFIVAAAAAVASSFRSIFYINILSCYHFRLPFDLPRFECVRSALFHSFSIIVRFDEPIDYSMADTVCI